MTPYTSEDIVVVLDSQRKPPEAGRLTPGVYFYNPKTKKYEHLEDVLVFSSKAIITEVDMGDTAIAEQTFAINAAVTSGSIIMGQVANIAPNGKDLDEIEMDSFDVKIRPDNGRFHLTLSTTDGSYLAGNFKVNVTWQ